MNTESIIKVSILTQNIDFEILINEDLDFDKSDNLLPHCAEITDSITTTEIQLNITLDNKQISNSISNSISNPISNTHKITNSVLELFRTYGNIIVSQHKIKIEFNNIVLIHKSLIQYSIECSINTCNCYDIIFYNDNDRNLISTVAFLSNLGFVLLNAKYFEGIPDNIPNNLIANPYKLASVYLKNIGMSDRICHLVEHILEIKIYNSRKAINAGSSQYYDNQLECIKTVIDCNDLGYNADNFKDIEKIENFELLLAIDKYMQNHNGQCRENEIDLYLDRFIKPKMISIMR